MDSSKQVAKLAKNSEVGQKIEKMRNLAKSHHRNSAAVRPLPSESPAESQMQILMREESMDAPKRSPKGRGTMTPAMFKRTYSKDLTKESAMLHSMFSVATKVSSKHKPSTNGGISHPSDAVKRDGTDSSDPEENESDANGANGGLDVNGDAGQEKMPADQLVVDGSEPIQDDSEEAKEHDNGDAKGTRWEGVE